MNDLVSIIIVNYNKRALLQQCLRSVYTQAYHPFEVIVVDNGSKDGSVDLVRSEFPDVHVVQCASNLGFAEGNNRGVAIAKGGYVVLLNNDTVVQSDWLKGLVESVAPADVAVASSLVKTRGIPEKYYEKNGSLNFLGHNIMRIFEKPENIFYAGGASLVYKKSILGIPFDKDYFAYSEDVYLSLRARFMGYRVVHTNASIVDHLGGGTAGSIQNLRLRMIQERNRLLNICLFFSGLTLVKILPFFIANIVVKSVVAPMFRRYSLVATAWAYCWLFLHPLTILQKREMLRTTFQVSDDEVVSWMTGNVAQGESRAGRRLNKAAVLYCRLVGLKTIESLPIGTR